VSEKCNITHVTLISALLKHVEDTSWTLFKKTRLSVFGVYSHL